jgi:hypothetical protein
MSKKNLSLFLLNLLGFVAMVTVNGLANALPINHHTTGELSDSYPNLFVPAGVTFSIWGIIYLLLLAFVIYQWLILLKKKEGKFIGTLGPWFFFSCLANGSWILAWHYELVFLSLLIMLLLLSCLLVIYQRLQIGLSGAFRAEKFLVHLPFSVYLGWITIATIANVTALLVHLGWNGFGLSQETWTIVMILAGTAITMAVLFTRQDIYFALVIIWALFGIYLKRTSEGVVAYPLIVTTVLVATALVAASIALQLFRGKWYR